MADRCRMVKFLYSHKGGTMKFKFLTLGAVALAGALALAGEKPSTGTIVSESSVDCGTHKQGKKNSTELLCQEYVVRTSTTEYHVRQQKPSNQALIPANTPIEFTVNKDKMKFKANGKKYEYLVVGESAVSAQPK
jgi:hypothetical protein